MASGVLSDRNGVEVVVVKVCLIERLGCLKIAKSHPSNRTAFDLAVQTAD